MTSDPIRIGAAGLGRAFMLTLPAFRADPRVRLVAACEPRVEARAAFEAEFGGPTYTAAEDLCADPAVEVVYVASPHQDHAAHAIAAAGAGKHALVEKPLAVTLADGRAMIAAAQAAGVQLIVGPSHSFDAPVLQARAIIASGEVGRVRMVHALNCTDFLYRPRRPEELRTDEGGGGVVFSQGAHQVDIVRLLCGGLACEVTAMVGDWDPARPTEGAYAALIRFEGGAFASLTYSGYARYDSDQLQGWVGELGHNKDPAGYGAARRALAAVAGSGDEALLKASRTYGAGTAPPAPGHHEHFGPVIAFCERADLRIAPDGVEVYRDARREFVTCPLRHPRAALLDALWDAVRCGRPPPQNGAWGLASLEVCHAILASARAGRPVALHHQTGSDR